MSTRPNHRCSSTASLPRRPPLTCDVQWPRLCDVSPRLHAISRDSVVATFRMKSEVREPIATPRSAALEDLLLIHRHNGVPMCHVRETAQYEQVIRAQHKGAPKDGFVGVLRAWTPNMKSCTLPRLMDTMDVPRTIYVVVAPVLSLICDSEWLMRSVHHRKPCAPRGI